MLRKIVFSNSDEDFSLINDQEAPLNYPESFCYLTEYHCVVVYANDNIFQYYIIITYLILLSNYYTDIIMITLYCSQ